MNGYVDKYGNETPFGPSMAVVKARARTVANRGRCSCGKLRDPGEVKRVGSRSWLPCLRCLGSIKQLS